MPKSGSITDDEFVALELKQLESVPRVDAAADDADEDGGIDEIVEPL